MPTITFTVEFSYGKNLKKRINRITGGYLRQGFFLVGTNYFSINELKDTD